LRKQKKNLTQKMVRTSKTTLHFLQQGKGEPKKYSMGLPPIKRERYEKDAGFSEEGRKE